MLVYHRLRLKRPRTSDYAIRRAEELYGIRFQRVGPQANDLEDRYIRPQPHDIADFDNITEPNEEEYHIGPQSHGIAKLGDMAEFDEEDRHIRSQSHGTIEHDEEEHTQSFYRDMEGGNDTDDRLHGCDTDADDNNGPVQNPPVRSDQESNTDDNDRIVPIDFTRLHHASLCESSQSTATYQSNMETESDRNHQLVSAIDRLSDEIVELRDTVKKLTAALSLQ